MTKYRFDFKSDEDNNIMSTIVRCVRKNSVVLEFGPAYGRLTKYLKEKLDCTVDIVEIDEEAGTEAASYARTSLIGPKKGDIDAFFWLETFKDNKYDYIIFADVLEHLRYPEKVLMEVYDILSDDGSVFITIPNISHNSILINLYNDRFRYTKTGILDDTHIRFWGINDFIGIIDRTKYSISEIKPFYLNPNMSEQAEFFPHNHKEIELLFKSRPQGEIYQYFIQLKNSKSSVKEFDLSTLSKRQVPLTIYFDLGNGFSEKNKIKYAIYTDEVFVKEIELETDIEALRIDPNEGAFSKVFIDVAIDGISVCDFYEVNAANKDEKGYFEFFTNDPWFIVKGPFAKGQSIKIKLTVEDIPIWKVVERLKQIESSLKDEKNYIQSQLAEEKLLTERLIESLNLQGSELNRLNNTLIDGKNDLNSLIDLLNDKDAEINSLNKTLNIKKNELNSLRNLLSDRDSKIINLTKTLATKNNEINTLRRLLNERETEVSVLGEALETKTKQNSDLKEQICFLQVKLDNVLASLEEICCAYNDILDSTCWKLTKPIRIFLDAVKSLLIIKKLRSTTILFRKTLNHLKHYGFRSTLKKIETKLFRVKTVKVKSFAPVIDSTCCEEDFVNTKTVSIIIPTKNGGDEFELLLKNLRSQKGFKEIEIVIVDSGSTDNTVDISKKYNAKVIKIKPEEFSHSYARNLGAENATMEYLCVMTQDALPTSQFWLYNLYQAMKNNPGVMAVSCAEYSRKDSDLYHRAFAWNHYKYLGAHNADVIMSMPKSNDPELIRKNAQLSDITCFIKRDTLLKYKYRGNFAEDLDLGMRLIADGYKLAFLGNEVVIHSHNRGPYYYLKRRFVELLTLKEIFPDQQILEYRYEQVLKETIFLFYYIDKILDLWRKKDNTCTFQVFRESFIRQYQEIRKKYYPKSERIDSMVESSKIDKPTEKILHAIIRQYKKFQRGIDEKYNGMMVDAMEGYLNVVFDFMSECYEIVDSEVISEYEECLYKILTSVTGTFLAYSYLSSQDDRNKYTEFYNQLMEGV